jgi:mono/diheme cytochrome c family protein
MSTARTNEARMKPHIIPILFSALLLLAVLVALVHPQAARALPEYSAQTGEPCATCHLSPSGGGPRGLRGQAWVGSSKPGVVPALTEALELLGIHLQVDERQYQATGEPVLPAKPVQVEPAQAQDMHDHLSSFDGN